MTSNEVKNPVDEGTDTAKKKLARSSGDVTGSLP